MELYEFLSRVKQIIIIIIIIEYMQVLLFGASDSYSDDKIMQVTVAFNHFGKGLIQRMPRVRYGFAHVVNNDYTKWEMYAMGGSQGPTLLSQGNRFFAPDNKNAKEVSYLSINSVYFVMIDDSNVACNNVGD